MLNVGCSPSIFCWDTCKHRGDVNLVRRELIFQKFGKELWAFKKQNQCKIY
jgi:hypothetical protein